MQSDLRRDFLKTAIFFCLKSYGMIGVGGMGRSVAAIPVRKAWPCNEPKGE